MDVQERCYLSHPAHPHFLSRRDNPPSSECFGCGPDGGRFKGDWHYYCDVCELVFHQDCRRDSVTGITHPFHLEHLLSLTIRPSIYENKILSFITQAEVHKSVTRKKVGDDISVLGNDNISVMESYRCDWCEKELYKIFYLCLVCGFCLDPSCIEKDPPFTISNPKSHQHPLKIFPRHLSVLCNACGLDDEKEENSRDKNVEPGYFCLPCNYFVHKSCIDLPRVIKLTRHPHRLSLTPCLPPPAKRSCGVCQRNINVKHGMYSCNKGCPYAIHSKCAIHKDIWDGRDLEDVPEEPERDVSPFQVVGNNLIKHFIHEHNLMFDEDEINHDTNKECQACCRPIDSSGFYRCSISHCDFFLHAPCANLPKMKEHPVHKHPLFLQPSSGDTCLACTRGFCGFSYACWNYSCKDEDGKELMMDVICASVCEPFEHKVHSHSLFLFSGKERLSQCGICDRDVNSIFNLKCNYCEFNMCFKCATIPVEIRYKHDEHLLTLSLGEDSSDPYWCERCERRIINPKKWFYTCDECCTTLHIDCLFDESAYLKIGWSMKDEEDDEVAYVSNKGNSRPVCYRCGARCRYRGFFKYSGVFTYSTYVSYCTTSCMNY